MRKATLLLWILFLIGGTAYGVKTLLNDSNPTARKPIYVAIFNIPIVDQPAFVTEMREFSTTNNFELSVENFDKLRHSHRLQIDMNGAEFDISITAEKDSETYHLAFYKSVPRAANENLFKLLEADISARINQFENSNYRVTRSANSER
ncbi:MAG: hypothetical protein EP340_07435 [Alphaproteobacteria bacterium]|nr:MAG: hypothetical protein EP340_07435 [Alphaproteobacteria bacterium]